jgi:hypothetical protein
MRTPLGIATLVLGAAGAAAQDAGASRDGATIQQLCGPALGVACPQGAEAAAPPAAPPAGAGAAPALIPDAARQLDRLESERRAADERQRRAIEAYAITGQPPETASPGRKEQP